MSPTYYWICCTLTHPLFFLAHLTLYCSCSFTQTQNNFHFIASRSYPARVVLLTSRLWIWLSSVFVCKHLIQLTNTTLFVATIHNCNQPFWKCPTYHTLPFSCYVMITITLKTSLLPYTNDF